MSKEENACLKKIFHFSKKEAKKAIKVLKKKPHFQSKEGRVLLAYKCKYCAGYHVGGSDKNKDWMYKSFEL